MMARMLEWQALNPSCGGTGSLGATADTAELPRPAWRSTWAAGQLAVGPVEAQAPALPPAADGQTLWTFSLNSITGPPYSASWSGASTAKSAQYTFTGVPPGAGLTMVATAATVGPSGGLSPVTRMVAGNTSPVRSHGWPPAWGLPAGQPPRARAPPARDALQRMLAAMQPVRRCCGACARQAVECCRRSFYVC